MFEHDTKNNGNPERRDYVSASIKVIEVSAQGVVCLSADNPEEYPGHEF